MKQLIEAYTDAAQFIEDWAFKHVVPRVLKVFEISLRFLLIYAFYLLIKNAIAEVL